MEMTVSQNVNTNHPPGPGRCGHPRVSHSEQKRYSNETVRKSTRTL